jgi:hypothetical protein
VLEAAEIVRRKVKHRETVGIVAFVIANVVIQTSISRIFGCCDSCEGIHGPAVGPCTR